MTQPSKEAIAKARATRIINGQRVPAYVGAPPRLRHSESREAPSPTARTRQYLRANTGGMKS